MGDQIFASIHHALIGLDDGKALWDALPLPRVVGGVISVGLFYGPDRRVLPKGTSFDHLQQKDIELMMDNINSYKRKKLHNRSAYEMFEFYYDRDVLEKLNAHYIEGNDIVLTPKLLK